MRVREHQHPLESDRETRMALPVWEQSAHLPSASEMLRHPHFQILQMWVLYCRHLRDLTVAMGSEEKTDTEKLGSGGL